MNVHIHPNAIVIKILVRDMTLFFHNTQVMVEIYGDIFIFYPVNLLTASCQDITTYLPLVNIWVEYSWRTWMRQCVKKIWQQIWQLASEVQLTGFQEYINKFIPCACCGKNIWKSGKKINQRIQLFGFRVSVFNFGWSNMLGHQLAGKCFTKWDAISLFIPLKTRQRSAGCSTPDHVAFCLFQVILIAKNRSIYFLIASICNKLPSHHATAVNSFGISSPAIILKSQFFLRCWLIPETRICSW